MLFLFILPVLVRSWSRTDLMRILNKFKKWPECHNNRPIRWYADFYVIFKHNLSKDKYTPDHPERCNIRSRDQVLIYYNKCCLFRIRRDDHKNNYPDKWMSIPVWSIVLRWNSNTNYTNKLYLVYILMKVTLGVIY